MPCIMRILTTLALAASAFAASSLNEAVESAEGNLVERDGVVYKVFQDLDLGTKMEFVTNSGICETNPGVIQHSGYFSVGPDMHMWFWFFEARNNPTTAPFSTWFNGGPGCSSMIGLFQENGPCNFVGSETEPRNNPFSFNEFAHMLYVDQPIGVGFSYGTDTVKSTVTAAPFVYKLLQAFFKQFPQYQSRDFGIFTESYGGHYGPGFADYVEEQNAKIEAGNLKAEKLNLIALGINNGFYDAVIQYKAYITYAFQNKYNQLITAAEKNRYLRRYNNRCKRALARCTTTNNTSQDGSCSAAQETCVVQIENPIIRRGNFDVYDVREPANDPFPPMNFIAYLNRADIKKKIGAHVSTNFEMCSTAAGVPFTLTGDDSRSFLAVLSDVFKSGIQVLLWAGDADFICNYKGGFEVVNAIDYADKAAFNKEKLKPYTVSGKQTGLFKTKGNLSWLQVFDAGHEVPYYQPQTALQVFKQTMSKKAISNT